LNIDRKSHLTCLKANISQTAISHCPAAVILVYFINF